jgi:hypothetical protein
MGWQAPLQQAAAVVVTPLPSCWRPAATRNFGSGCLWRLLAMFFNSQLPKELGELFTFYTNKAETTIPIS